MIKVLIIGLGKIGLLYNIKKNKLSQSTHCGFLYKKKNFKIVGAVEKKKKLINIFKNYFNCESFNSIKEAIKKTDPNLVIIATPTNTHLKVYKEVISNNTKNTQVILFEKPVGKNFEEIKKIKKILKKKKLKIFVNYSRDYEKSFIRFSKFFQKSGFCNAEVSYNGEFINNASHFISLFVKFFGKVKKIESLKKRGRNSDYYINFILYFKNCLLNLKKNNIKTSHSFKIKCDNGDLLEYSNKSKYFYFNKSKIFKNQTNTIKRDHSYIYEEIEKFFLNKKYFMSDLDNAVYVHKIMKKCTN
jgi:predicted dehydrogenase